jgi:hypothetical protein
MTETGQLVRWKIDMSETRSYPRHVKTDGGDIEFRLMARADEPTVLAFAQKLPTHDLLFLPRNISQPKVLSAWINEIERGQITSLLAVKDGTVVGYGTLVRDPHSWSPHVGEIRMVVSMDVRGQGSAGRCRRRPLRWRWARTSFVRISCVVQVGKRHTISICCSRAEHTRACPQDLCRRAVVALRESIRPPQIATQCAGLRTRGSSGSNRSCALKGSVSKEADFRG